MHKPGEIRIGLVLYGGVSLAVYINGVAQEFFRAVRGDGIYRLLKALLGADIVVDVISGTSAGGLNGIYLAYALCQEDHARDFLKFSELWRNHGDISLLLRSPGEPSPQSLLKGETYYQDKLREAFTDMQALESDPEDASKLTELDLFVTGTDFHGFVYTRFDGTGRPITVKDHRTLFQLKFRRGRYNDFAASGDITPEELHGELAKLARITSCFPVAFPPVRVGEDDRLKHDPLRGDRLIRKWGQLTRKPLMPGQKEGEEPPRYYLDGGVLDNKPFSSTIQAIFHRTATRPVTRKLFYVEPAPEVFDPEVVGAPPNVVEAGVGALTAIPGYESIAGDLQAIRERNTRIQRFRNLAAALTREPDSKQDSQPTPEQRDIYRLSRLNVLLDRVLIGLLRQSGHEVLLDAGEQRLASRLFAEFFRTFDAAAQNQVLDDFDTDVRMRRLFYVTYVLEATSASVADDALATDTCNRWIKCLEVLRFVLESAIDQLPLRWYDVTPDGPQLRPPAEVWRETGMALGYVLAADPQVTALLDGPPDQAAVTSLRDILLGRINELKGKAVAPPAPAPSVLRHLDAQFEKAGFLEGSDIGLKAWERFPRIDLHRYPLQAAAGIFEMDFIDTVRISPRDARLGFSRKERPSDKLSGDQMANFGGFFKRSWRSNDLLWGRLDGLARIVETLLSRDALEAATADADPKRADARRGVIESMKLPPELADWLLALADPRDSEKHREALAALDAGAAQQKGGKLDLLVRHAQLDLLQEGLKAVAEDSIKEQIEWNRCRTGDPGRTKFHIDDLRFTRPNSGFISLAAQKMALEALESGAVPDLAAFFEKQYTVGQESLAEDVPKPVLAELATRATLVLRNCLAPAGGALDQAIRKSPLFRYGFDWPVRSAHGFAQLVRSAPTTARVVTWVAAAYSVVALVAGLKWWRVFVWPQDQGLQVWALGGLIVAPAVILGALPEMLEWEYPHSSGVVRRYGPWGLLAVMAVAAAFGVVRLAELRTGLEQFLDSKSGPISDALLAGCAVVAGAGLVWVFGRLLSALRKRIALERDPGLDR